MTIDFMTIQQQFEDLHKQGGIPTSVTIAEADYPSFVNSIFPAKEWTAFERDLLGDARIAELDEPRERAMHFEGIASIINFVTGSAVKLIRDPIAASGTFGMEWIEP